MKKLFFSLIFCAIGLVAFGQTPVPITLLWDANAAADQVTSYRIYQKVGTNFTYLATTTTNRYSLSIVPNRVTYAVTASNLWGEGGFSAEASTPNVGPVVNNLSITR